jgi:hypothetical protein
LCRNPIFFEDSCKIRDGKLYQPLVAGILTDQLKVWILHTSIFGIISSLKQIQEVNSPEKAEI